MTETSREELVTAQRELEEKIALLSQKIDFIPDPFSKLSMGQVRRGGTGAARRRRIPLYPNEALTTGDIEFTSHGSFNEMAHIEMTNAATDVIYYNGVIVPTDYIATGQVTFNYFYTNDGLAGDVDWVVLVKSVAADTSTDDITLLNDSTSVTVPGVQNQMTLRSVALTRLPKVDVHVFARLERTTGDSNASDSAVWGAYLEYVSFI